MTADINHGWLDPATGFPIRGAADLCGVSTQALERDHGALQNPSITPYKPA